MFVRPVRVPGFVLVAGGVWVDVCALDGGVFWGLRAGWLVFVAVGVPGLRRVGAAVFLFCGLLVFGGVGEVVCCSVLEEAVGEAHDLSEGPGFAYAADSGWMQAGFLVYANWGASVSGGHAVDVQGPCASPYGDYGDAVRA